MSLNFLRLLAVGKSNFVVICSDTNRMGLVAVSCRWRDLSLSLCLAFEGFAFLCCLVHFEPHFGLGFVFDMDWGFGFDRDYLGFDFDMDFDFDLHMDWAFVDFEFGWGSEC